MAVNEWRQIVGNAFVHGLRDTFVVVNAPGPEVLELKVHRLEPHAVIRDVTIAGQADYFVTLELPEGQSLGRAADVVEGPTTVAGSPYSSQTWKQFDPMVAGTLEKVVRESCAKLLPQIPAEFPRSQQTGMRMWAESPRMTQPNAPSPSRKCVASELPQWKTASAVEKRALLDQCR